MQFFFYFLFSLAAAYALFLLWCHWGWMKSKEVTPSGTTNTQERKTTVSIIIPVRNEEHNIAAALADLVSQQYSSDLYEIIVVDDHSIDNTVQAVQELIEQHRKSNKIQLLQSNGNGNSSATKKTAITQAINVSYGELIITTDADCRRGQNWLSSIVTFYETNQPLMISAPVKLTNEKNWFEKIQSLEFMGLIGIGAGSISNHCPILCNGANLAFSKETFYKVNGYETERMLATGDDTQLLLKIARIEKRGILFLKSEEAVVSTAAVCSWKQLFHQRTRWASKIPLQMTPLTVSMAVVAYLLNLSLLLGMVFIFCTDTLRGSGKIFLLALSVKIVSEYLLLSSVASFLKKKKLLWLLLPAQLYYIIYIIIIGIASLFGKYEWKGRRFNTA